MCFRNIDRLAPGDPNIRPVVVVILVKHAYIILATNIDG